MTGFTSMSATPLALAMQPRCYSCQLRSMPLIRCRALSARQLLPQFGRWRPALQRTACKPARRRASITEVRAAIEPQQQRVAAPGLSPCSRAVA